MAHNDERADTASTIADASAHPLQELLDIGANKDNLRTLVKLLESNGMGIIPFVGAGLSAPYGFAIWRDFLLKQAEQAGIRSMILKRIKSGQYEEAADDLYLALGKGAFHDSIDAEYGDHKLKNKSVGGVHAQLVKIAIGPLITTNFDRVLEEAFKQANSEFIDRVLGAKGQITRNALNENQRLLFKIHGDFSDNTERILTLDDYQRHYGQANGIGIDMTKPLPKLLHAVLLGRPLLFIGCSLNNDRTINVIKRVADEFGEIRHWAIVEMPTTKKGLIARNRFLSEHLIRPIWYPHGQHDFVEKILDYLANHVNPL